jgi:cleavage stimulation factor subunit 2
MVSVNSQVFASRSPPPPASLDPWILNFFSQDHETALSAVRNLNNVDVGGRPLRIDLADSDPFLEGKTTVRGELIDGGETRAQWRERENSKRDKEPDSGKDGTSFLRNLPQGVPVPLGASALDMISQTLATMNPTQLVEVLAQFKVCHPRSC